MTTAVIYFCTFSSPLSSIGFLALIVIFIFSTSVHTLFCLEKIKLTIWGIVSQILFNNGTIPWSRKVRATRKLLYVLRCLRTGHLMGRPQTSYTEKNNLGLNRIRQCQVKKIFTVQWICFHLAMKNISGLIFFCHVELIYIYIYIYIYIN